MKTWHLSSSHGSTLTVVMKANFQGSELVPSSCHLTRLMSQEPAPLLRWEEFDRQTSGWNNGLWRLPWASLRGSYGGSWHLSDSLKHSGSIWEDRNHIKMLRSNREEKSDLLWLGRKRPNWPDRWLAEPHTLWAAFPNWLLQEDNIRARAKGLFWTKSGFFLPCDLPNVSPATPWVLQSVKNKTK